VKLWKQLNAFAHARVAKSQPNCAVTTPRFKPSRKKWKKSVPVPQPLFKPALTIGWKELLKGMQLEPQRLAQEAAVLADRSVCRRGTGASEDSFDAARCFALIAGAKSVSAWIFLLQEMNREDQHNSFQNQRHR
jgi:hypothetical protein